MSQLMQASITFKPTLFFYAYLFYSKRERARAHTCMSGGGAERKREREGERIPNRLCAVSPPQHGA